MNAADVAGIVELIRGGKLDQAAAQLVRFEGSLFLAGDRHAAGELGYARFELARGHEPGAVEVLRRLAATLRRPA